MTILKNLLDTKINYDKIISDKLEKIRDYDCNNNNLMTIEFIIVIIDILCLIYNYIIDANKKNTEEKNKDINFIREHLNKIIIKIKLIKLPEEIIKEENYNVDFFVDSKNLINFVFNLSKYKGYLSKILYNSDLPEYNLQDIWDYIYKLLEECSKLHLEFVLILDQYKNSSNETNKYNELIQKFKNSKIIICCSIDDYDIRDALLKNKFPDYINFQQFFITLEDIQNAYNESFLKFSDKKKRAINLYKNNAREIFEIMNVNDENLEAYNKEKINKIKTYLQSFCNKHLERI